jgi:hypothetical protein
MGAAWIILLFLIVLVTGAIGQGTNGAAHAATIIFFPAAIALYFSPTIIAATRRHPAASGVALINLFLGWTVLGWAAALMWAYSGLRGEIEEKGEPEEEMRQCPYCAEDIRSQAIKCRYCGSDLTPVEATA